MTTDRSQPTDLPPPIGIDQPDSFSWNVFHKRHPALIADLQATFPYPRHIRDKLEALLTETLEGGVPAQPPVGPDQTAWAIQITANADNPWATLPFLWAESYFYRRLLEATDYFTPNSPWNGVDPFAPQKNAQLDSPELRADLNAYSALANRDLQQRRQALLYASLWGNQADLGFRTANPNALQPVDAGNIVIDDSDRLWNLIDKPGTAPVIVVADNAGRELTADLALIDCLLEADPSITVELHLKSHPYYVSDATGHDLLACLATLSTSTTTSTRALAARLQQAITTERLHLRSHEFYTLPATYRDLPTDLIERFHAAKLVILKGDLNYRRLVGDLRWDATSSFAEAAAYFPTAVAALRTAKSDLAVGIDPSQLATLESASPSWRIDGTHAVIQVLA